MMPTLPIARGPRGATARAARAVAVAAASLLLAAPSLAGQKTAAARSSAPRRARASAWAADRMPNVGRLKLDLTRYHDAAEPCPSGCYAADVAAAVARAKAYLAAHLGASPRPALVLDIDETSLSNWSQISALDYGRVRPAWDAWYEKGEAAPIAPTLDLFRFARLNRVAVFFVSGRKERLREATERNLRAAGFDGWEELFMRAETDEPCPGIDIGNPPSATVCYKAGVRRRIEERGFRIVANVGDQDSDLAGGHADRAFKIPNPFYLIP